MNAAKTTQTVPAGQGAQAAASHANKARPIWQVERELRWLRWGPRITTVLLAIFFGYIFLWWRGLVEGNFPLLLLLVTMVSGLYFWAEKAYFLPRRVADKPPSEAKIAARQPWWLDWTAGMFPVIATVFLLRSFLFEPFKIPSGSMLPTLEIGDLILVNKFHYGVRLPVLNAKILANNVPERGDVVVFRYPENPRLDYIKRVVGVPGDVVEYDDKKLRINGRLIATESLVSMQDENGMFANHFLEALPTSDGGFLKHRIFNHAGIPAAIRGGESGELQFPHRDACRYHEKGVVCTVPAGNYFMMGDNRDNSQDSRYWGFMPEENIVGKAVMIWMNFDNLQRIGWLR